MSKTRKQARGGGSSLGGAAVDDERNPRTSRLNNNNEWPGSTLIAGTNHSPSRLGMCAITILKRSENRVQDSLHSIPIRDASLNSSSLSILQS